MPENRVTDQPYGTYSVCSVLKTGLWVTCPRCGGMGLVTRGDGPYRFRCTRCGHARTKELSGYRFRVQNQCPSCGRYYNITIQDRRQQTFPVLRVTCPYCGFAAPGRVEQTGKQVWYGEGGDLRQGQDPAFGFDLWFLTSFGGRPVWALNREHLAYLIGYLSAGLREKPAGRFGLRTEADTLPGFMKTAKNRDRLVRRLKELQKK